MSGEFSPAQPEAHAETKQPTQKALELAGALHAVVAQVPNRDFQLDLHQEEELNAIGLGLLDGENAGYIEAATGSGKSLLISLLAEAAVNAGQRVHILASTKQNANQIMGKTGEGLARFSNLLQRKVVKENYDNKRANAKYPVVVSTYAGFLEEFKKQERGEGRLGEFDLILGDECHRSLGTETSRALYLYMPNAVKVGFSATADYAIDRRSDEIWGRQWFEFSLRDSIEAGKAAPIRALVLSTDARLDLVDYRQEFTEKELAPLINNFERNGLAAQLAQDFIKEGRQGIIACIPGNGNAHATAMADLLSQQEVNGRKLVVKDIGSHLRKDVYDQRLKDFEAGKIDILTFTKAIEESWDTKKASFCINLSPTASPVRIKQLLGRIARPNEDERESIFVDFVDDKMGSLQKMQYTAIHALEYEDIDIDRVLGWAPAGAGGQTPQRRSIITHLRPELYERLMRIQGKALNEILAGKKVQVVNPLFVHWERVLTKEGMPSEMPYNVAIPPALDRKYQKVAAQLHHQLGVEPTAQEVIISLTDITGEQQKLLEVYGERVENTAGQLVYEQAEESVEDIIARLMLKKTIGTVLKTFSEQEEAIVRQRFLQEESATLKQIAAVHDLSVERIRQKLNVTLKKLQHHTRADLLRDFAYETRPPEPPKLKSDAEKVYEDHHPISVFAEFNYIRVNDPRDNRPYRERLAQAAVLSADRWHREQLQALGEIRFGGQSAKEHFKLVARGVEPKGYWLRNSYYPAGSPELQGDDFKYADRQYDLYTLQTLELQRRQQLVQQQLTAHYRARARVESAITPSESSVANAMTVLTPKIEVLERHLRELNYQIHRYEQDPGNGDEVVLSFS